jgi:hypothetical protein
MLKKAIPQHKRLAQGGEHTPLGYARGGSVGTGHVSGTAKNPLTAARRNNGVKGMKEGGKC